MPSLNGIHYYQFEPEIARSPVIVLIHGAGATHLVWPPELRRMTHWRTLALDLPGHGKSAGTGEQAVSMYREHLAAWMTSLELFRVLVVGHGLGAQIALDLGLHESRLVAGLVLLGAAARMPVSNAFLDGLASPASMQGAIKDYAEQMAVEPGDENRTRHELERLRSTRPGVLHGDFLASQTYDPGLESQELLKPVLVLSGDRDRVTPTRYSQFLAKKIPGSQLEFIHEAGHLVMHDQPGQVVEQIETFIRSRLHLPAPD
jgi:pimeloyl-ACP methyl ester carboxylesterase